MKNNFININKFFEKFLLRTMYLNLFFLGITLEMINSNYLYELLFVDFIVCLILVYYWFKKKWRISSLEFKFYFILIIIYGLIHSICFTFSEFTDLLNSKFYKILILLLLITLPTIIYLTFFTSKKFKL